MSITRTTELRKAIEAAVERIAHLAEEARSLEGGRVEIRRKYDQADAYEGRDETLKFQPAAAVGYWRELREQEERLEKLRAELRGLRARRAKPIHMKVDFDGPQDSEESVMRNP
jgi:predicted RNase H-like nuclease (RuvC/YqgF family)